MVADECVKYRSVLELSHPTSEGIVKNWDDMQLIWERGFQKIGLDDFSELSIMMTEAA